MTDANVCPRTNEVCLWREKGIAKKESVERMQVRAEALDSWRKPFRQRFRKIAPIFGIHMLTTGIYEDMAADFKEEATKLEAILEMNCTREGVCIAYEAMIENHIVEPKGPENQER